MVDLDHIALIVLSKESLSFYEKLGFKETKRKERPYDTVAYMQWGRIILEIFIDLKHPKRASDPEAKGLRHIAFSVDNLDEIMKIVKCEEVRTDWFGRKFTFTKDPDGRPIELIEQKTDIRPAKYNTEDKWVQEHREQFGIESSFV